MSDTWWVDEGELFDEQLLVLGEDLEQDLLLSGPPGSGKTNILLLRANHLFLASPHLEFYIVCFTSLLQNFIRLGAHRYQYPANRIITQRKLFEQVLSDHGLLPKRVPGESFRDRQAILREAMSELMHSGNAKNTFPVLFIDEAQDYSEVDLAIFDHLARYLSCAADPRQGIYGEASSGGPWLKQHNWGTSISLKYHHRVAPAVLEVADKIMLGKLDHKSMLETHQYKGDPGDIEVESGLCLEGQIDAAVPRILKQLEVYPGQLIGVMVPRRVDVETVVKRLCADPKLVKFVTNAMSQEFDSNCAVWVSTVHSAKGLEYRCCHILGADGFAEFREHERRAVFTAVTRAKTSLTIYHEKELHAFFASSLAKKNTSKIETKNLFGKKS